MLGAVAAVQPSGFGKARLIKLYAQSRQLRRSIFLLFSLGVVAWVWGSYQLNLPGLRTSDTVLVPVILIVPLASAIVIGLSTRTWLGDLERAAPRRLVWCRLIHAVVLCAVGAALLIPSIDPGHGSYGAAAAARNVLGYAGLAYLCSALVGGELSWVLPLAYALPLPLFGVNEDRTVSWWAWPLQPAESGVSWVWASLLVIVGIGMFVLRSPRPRHGTDNEQ